MIVAPCTGSAERGTLRDAVTWAVAGAAIGVVALLGLLVRYGMLANRLPLEGQYAVNVQYGPWYLASTGRLFSVAGEIPSVSNYTSGVNYGAVDFTQTLLHGSALSLAGLHDPLAIARAYFLLPWQSTILVPLAVIAVYCRVVALRGGKVAPAAVVIVFAFASTGHYAMVSWGLSGGLLVPYGWLLLVAAYLAVLARGTGAEKTAWSALVALILVLIQPTYHTAAISLLIILITVGATQLLSPIRILPVRTLVLALTVFVAFLAYSATPFLRAYSLIGVSFFARLLQSEITTPPAHLFRITGWLLVVQVVNYLAIAALVAMFVRAWWLAHRARDVTHWYHLLWLGGLVPLAIGFFAWNGLLGMEQRLLQFGTLLTGVGIAVVLAQRPEVWRSFGLVAAVAVTAALVSVPLSHLGDSALVTADEWAAVRYYAARVGCDHVLFTDFRIGPVATYSGCFNVIGPTASSLALSGQSQVVDQLFYSHDPSEIEHAVDAMRTTDGRKADLILISDEMAKPEGGPVLPDGRLRPMTKQTINAYRNLPGWTTIYRNSSVALLARMGLIQVGPS